MSHLQIYDPNTRRFFPVTADTDLLEMRATMHDWMTEGGTPAELPDRMAALAQVISFGITDLRRERIWPIRPEIPAQE